MQNKLTGAFLMLVFGCGGEEFTLVAADLPIDDAGGTAADARRGERSDSAVRVDADAAAATADAGDAAPLPSDSAPDSCAPIAHATGTGQTYLSCDPLGTWAEGDARLACLAYAATLPPDAGPVCGQARVCPDSMVICSDQNGDGAECRCWAFSAPPPRDVLAGRVGRLTCACPIATDPSWN